MFTVTLKRVKNRDINGGYWSHPTTRSGKKVVATLKDARSACMEFIATNDLGSGNWFGGEIYDINGMQVARVSYNGRVWDMDGCEIKM